MNSVVRTFVLLAIGGLAVCHVFAQGAGSRFFNTKWDKSFGYARPALNKYLDAQPPLKQERQHFCIVGYDNGQNVKQAYVYWREGQKLILWEGTRLPEYAAESIVNSRSQLDLTKDVVKSEADIAGSTYLVTEAWVASIKNDCKKKGAKYSIKRLARRG